MAYNRDLASRVSLALSGQLELDEKRMFGGVGYLLRGNMACGVRDSYLIIRVGPENHDSTLAEPHTRVFDITERAMKGWVMVDPEGYATEEALQGWLQRGVALALSLPPK